MTALTFGVFDWVDRRDVPLAQLFEERLRVAAAADEAGFFCYHLAEHHATPLGMAASPSVFLAAVAQRTRRIRLGPLVYLLPLYSPLRLVEEIAMLDHLSGGRLELGVGRGVSPYEVEHFGVDPAQSRPVFEEALEVLLAGMTQQRLTHHGALFQFTDVPMELRPVQQPYPPLWYATSNPDTVPWVAERGLNLMGLGPAEAFRPFVERYREVAAENAASPLRLNPHVPAPRIGMNRLALVAETDAEAEALVRAAHPRYAASFTKLWHDHDNHTYDKRMALDAALQAETILCGSPARVREQVQRLTDVTGVNYVTCAFAWGDLTLEQSLRSLRLFAEEVVPHFQN